MSATDQDIHNAIMDQIMYARNSAMMGSCKPPKIETYMTRGAIEAYIRAYPHSGNFANSNAAGISCAEIAGTRVFVMKSMPGVWFLTFIRKSA